MKNSPSLFPSLKVSRPLEEFPTICDTAPDIIAIGGDLSVNRLLEAYRKGLFPWYNSSQPILWWSPYKRGIIPLEGFRMSRRLQRTIKRGEFEIRINSSFEKVMEFCADRGEESGEGWITDEMVAAYTELHKKGYAHSVESWHGGELVGGLYGVAMGGLFAGESMFFRKSDASKVALAALVERLKERRYTLLDCQMVTGLTESLGAIEIERKEYLQRLEEALNQECSFV